MQAQFDFPAVHRFTADSNDRVHRCENGEAKPYGERITTYSQACDEFRAFMREWAQAVFSGRITYDHETEDHLKREGLQLLRRAKTLAAHGRTINGVRHDLAELKELHGSIATLDYMLENWVTPQLAVGPSARVRLPEQVVDQIRESIGKLQPKLAEPQQLAVVEQQG